MNEHSQYLPGSQDAKSAAATLKAVDGLVRPGNPKSNLFAMCLIFNCEQNAHFSIKAVDTMTKEFVLHQIELAVEDMRKLINEAN